MNSIDWLLHIPEQFGDREFLFDAQTEESVSFATMHDSASRIAADFRRRGMRQGDRMLLVLNNSATFAKIYLGCLYAGVVVVPLNPVLARAEIQKISTHCGAKLALVSAETASLIDVPALRQAGVSALRLEDGCQGVEQTADLPVWDVRNLPGDEAFQPFDGVTSEDISSIVFTSGTTGSPSGVVHRIADMIENARAFNQCVGIDETNRFYGVLAMTYLGGYYNLLMLPYCAGASVVLDRAFDAPSALHFWKRARCHRVNTLWFVPTILAILLETDRGRDGEAFCRECLKLALVGTAPLPVPLRQEVETRYGITLYENYGLSETFFISTNSPSTPVLDACVGRSTPGVRLTVADARGRSLPHGQEGEIHVSTPYLMAGYYNLQTQQIDPVDRDAPFPTGDLGKLTAAGDLYITGRQKNLIIRGGVNVSPAEIENVVHRHPQVAECAAVGVPHAIYGEEIAVAVRLKSGSFSEVRQAILAQCKRRLGGMKQVSHLLELKSFPRSSTGKIQHQKVREILKSKLNGAADASSPADDGLLVLPGRVRRDRPKISDALLVELAQYPSSLLSDAMNRLSVMNGSIRPLVNCRPFCGRALTVEETEGGNLMSHAASEMIQPGDVLVIDAKGVSSRACWGGLQTLMAQKRGAAALVINGAVRDIELVRELDIPIYAVGVASGGPMKGWGGNVNFPIACGGTVVNAGDVVRGDDDGIVVIPCELAEAVLACCKRRHKLEQIWFEKVEAGQSTVEAVGLREKIAELRLDVVTPATAARVKPAA